jgi:hypothetical protein
MTRLEKLNECLEIARKHKNPYMEQNILAEITREIDNPLQDIYPDKADTD